MADAALGLCTAEKGIESCLCVVTPVAAGGKEVLGVPLEAAEFLEPGLEALGPGCLYDQRRGQ